MRELDAAGYIGTLKELVEEGHEVSLLISGSSMAPFLIHHRDMIYFKAPDRALKRGDMVFFQRESGQFVMHRIRFVKADGYYLIGDGQRETEGPIARERIFAVVTAVRRKGKVIRPGAFTWEFFARVWLRLIPLRGIISRLYARLS